MHYFTPDQVPVISTLAKAFGVCDQWYGSAPCQTWPKSLLAHTALPRPVGNSTSRFPFLRTAYWGRRQRQNLARISDMPQSGLAARHLAVRAVSLPTVQINSSPTPTPAPLPSYSFIEPRYFTDLILRKIPNDEHPPHNVIYGETADRGGLQRAACLAPVEENAADYHVR